MFQVHHRAQLDSTIHSKGCDMGNPVDEALEFGSEKKAGFLDAIGRGARGAFGGEEIGRLAVQTGAVAGVGVLASAARKAYSAATKSMDYKAMLDMNPDLAEHAAANPKQFNQYYSSLRQLNPTFAADPVVSGSYLRKMCEFPSGAGNYLVEATGQVPRPNPSRIKDYATGLDVADRGSRPSELDRYRLQEQKAKARKAEQDSYGAEE
jgi:hypothetical protein